MSRGLLWFSTTILFIIFAVSALFYVARSQDGPMEIIAGGPFTTGEAVSSVSDWHFLDENMTIELQTMLPLRSRTMWLVVVSNRPFVLSSYMTSRIGKIWKQWPHRLEEDNRALIRADGKIYALNLQRRIEDDIIPEVLARFNEKYKTDYDLDNVSSGSSWIYELTPPEEKLIKARN